MKVCVYAICKNEEKFIDRWVESMKEADYIYVLDTGSTDNSIQKLKEKNIIVKSAEIEPWRFDTARNLSLEMVPVDTDICVCTDLDEVFLPGWRNKLEKKWTKETTRMQYNYNWSLDKNGNPIVSFYADKIHSRNNYKWTHPVHEVLSYSGKNEHIAICNSITLNHYPDLQKSRSSYLPLLELSVKEDPNDDRNMHYLGREYMFYERYNEAIDTLIKHLHLPKATWKDERCASMRFIARSYIALERYDEADMWLNKAINEAPYLREPFVEYAMLNYILQNWNKVVDSCNKALQIKSKYKNYITESFCWDNTIYDLLSIAHFYEKDYEKAIKYVNIALQISPNDKRLIDNKKTFKQYLKNNKVN